MNWVGSGFIPVLIYASVISYAPQESISLITENGADNILTESSSNIDIE